MTLTLPELQDKLKEIDEVTLLEQLNVTSEDLVERFVDVIEDRFEQLSFDFEEDDAE